MAALQGRARWSDGKPGKRRHHGTSRDPAGAGSRRPPRGGRLPLYLTLLAVAID